MEAQIESASQADGVTEQTAEVSAEEASPTTQTEVQETPKPKSENRYQKLANENRVLREKVANIAEYEKQISDLQNAKNLDAWLRSDARNAKAFINLMNELNQPQPNPDDEKLSQLDPWVAEQFKQLKELREWKAQQEQQRISDQKKTVQEVQQTRDAEYDQFLEKNGYVKDGKPVDTTLVDGFDKITLAWLAQNATDWKKPTAQEMKDACNYAHTVVESGKRLGMKSTIKQPGVPPSGSKQGGTPPSKAKDTDQARQARIYESLMSGT